ncbi:toll/interleukin-1 receptor domain-containing protein [Priestia flexa]|uniref:toll/interleukin-1 receptor domain-containing protein n=1 Tax=Priestia flexa TaxID=86664 RepID=UPI0020A1F26F|nr:toll/interleukin-1 receptor domain-containing protein [Priestia flexa]MCP1188030.1 toll/interleukin-1 receptor domain-containing protein [Priestia flexa]
MFVGFELKTEESFIDYLEIGKKHYDNSKRQVYEKLSQFLSKDGSIDGTAMQNHWFPMIDTDIFISHSHANKDKAIALAGWLKKEFDLDVFIDSCVWGFANDLLLSIDNEYCRNVDDTFYVYEKRNYSTSHVHMMLSTALNMMIDNCECIMFLNTPESIESEDVIKRTKSPWIYSEIAISKLIRRKKPNREKVLLEKSVFASKELIIKYDVETEHLIDLTGRDLNVWKSIYHDNKHFHPLDILYHRHHVATMTEENVGIKG